MFNWHEKKNMHKKNAQPSPQKFNGPSLVLVLCRDEPITKNCRLADSMNRQPITMYNRPINRH